MTEHKEDKSIKILDCTLRDGGYYNDWDFPRDIVCRYLEVMTNSGIDFVEIGFRFDQVDRFLGPYAYSTDHWLQSLPLPEGVGVGVMCNAKDLVKDDAPDKAVRRMFKPAKESPVELVRIAAHFSEVESCDEAVMTLHDLGYRVGFNLMQSGGRSRQEISDKAGWIREWPLEVLYFADSLGNMNVDDVAQTVDALRDGWNGEIGFHSHDNMGNALANTMAAIRAGTTWVDATVLGMGRGAGNVRLEYLLLELARRNLHGSKIDSLLDFVVTEFGELQRKYQWGPNLFYYLSGLYGVHPTYVQEMLGEDRYSHDQVVSALQRLGQEGASGYSRSRLMEALEGGLTDSDGTWEATGWATGRDVLIVGPGDQGRSHLDGITQYIEKKRPLVLCLNSNSWLPESCVDAWVACNPQRLVLDCDFYKQNRGLLITPKEVVPESVAPALKDWNVLDFGLKITPAVIEAAATGAVLPRALAALYAMTLSEAAGAERILLAGMDGYSSGDPRNREMEECLELYANRGTALPVVALTPTRLPVTQRSLYAPEI